MAVCSFKLLYYQARNLVAVQPQAMAYTPSTEIAGVVKQGIWPQASKHSNKYTHAVHDAVTLHNVGLAQAHPNYFTN